MERTLLAYLLLQVAHILYQCIGDKAGMVGGARNRRWANNTHKNTINKLDTTRSNDNELMRAEQRRPEAEMAISYGETDETTVTSDIAEKPEIRVWHNSHMFRTG